jgi:hypothetical protein
MTTRQYRTWPCVATPELAGGQPIYRDAHAHPHEGAHPHQHRGLAPVPGVGSSRPRTEPSAPTQPSRAVLLDIGEHRGALVLKAPPERAGTEVEIHPVSDPSQRTHVWVLPREGREGTVYAAVFPSLLTGDHAVLEPDGSVATTVAIAPNHVTTTNWG